MKNTSKIGLGWIAFIAFNLMSCGQESRPISTRGNQTDTGPNSAAPQLEDSAPGDSESETETTPGTNTGTEPETETETETEAEANEGTENESQDDTNSTDPSSCNGVLDSASGLCWEDPTYFGPNDAGVTWAEGIAYCNQLSIDGVGGWRMPNVDEVRTFIAGCPTTESSGACTITDGCEDTSFSAACDGCSQFQGPTNGCYWQSNFSGPCPGNVWLWTSSESIDPGLPFFYDPSVGRLGRTFDVFPMAVRCVRGPN